MIENLPYSLRQMSFFGYWGATEQKTRLRIQVTSTIEPDGPRSDRNWGMATIRDGLCHDRNPKIGVDPILIRDNLRPVCWP
jgi:hypothetical protein